MKIEYLHASKYGNGAIVAAEFKQQMQARRWAPRKPTRMAVTAQRR